jgi:hypothetical protein
LTAAAPVEAKLAALFELVEKLNMVRRGSGVSGGDE